MNSEFETSLRWADLEAARDEYEDLFASIRSILISVDSDGLVRRWSDTAAKAFGIEREQATGVEFSNLAIQWDWLAVKRAIEVSRQANLPAKVEDLEYTAPNGDSKLLGLTVSPSRRGGFLIMGADVTYRKIEERQLMERERFYRSIVDNIQDVIFETDADGRWTFLNPSFSRFSGQTVNEATGRMALESISVRERRKALVALRPLLRREMSTMRFEVLYRRPDGADGWAEVNVESQFEEGEFVGTFGTIREVSERKRNEDLERRLAEQLLKATEDRVKTIIESAPLMVFSLDSDSNLTFIDGKVLEKLGRTRDELEGLNMLDFVAVHPEVVDAIRQALNGKPSTVEIHTSGLYLQIRYTPVYDAEGRPNGATGVAIDITDSKLLETQLMHARKMESIGQLAAGLAHEVNTPTQYVADNTRFSQDSFVAISETLREAKIVCDGRTDQPSADFINHWREREIDYLLEEIPAAFEQSLEGLARVTQIIRSMKEFSHPGSKERCWADLKEQIESTITVSRNEWKYVANVETEFEDGMPKVWCYPAELNQVVLNMIVNAAHAIEDCISEGKYPLGTIKVGLQTSGAHAKITVSDNGRGIPKAILDKVFDPFFTTKDPGKGTGQGLALAHTTVERHDGQILIESQPGSGTTFTILIPIAPAAEQPMIQQEAA